MLFLILFKLGLTILTHSNGLKDTLTNLNSLSTETLQQQDLLGQQLFSKQKFCNQIQSHFQSYTQKAHSINLQTTLTFQSLKQAQTSSLSIIEKLQQDLSYNQSQLDQIWNQRCDQTGIFTQAFKDLNQARGILAVLNTDIKSKPKKDQLKKDLTEILDRHVENSLVEALDQIKPMVNQRIFQLEKDELKASSDFVQWKSGIQKEIQKLKSELEKEQEKLQYLQAQIFSHQSNENLETAESVERLYQEYCEEQMEVLKEEIQKRVTVSQLVQEAVEMVSNAPELKIYTRALSGQ